MTRLLIIQHEDNCGPAWLGEWWADAGARLDVVAANREQLPATLQGSDALVVLGGSMNATADAEAPWLPGTRALIRSAVEADIPFLGVCLGHQLAAVALGGVVEKNAVTTLGLTPVGMTSAGRSDALLSAVGEGARAIHYNGDHVTTLPSGAQPLAYAPDGHVQAARFAPRAWGVQFHPECSPEGFAEWTVEKPDDAAEWDELRRLGAPARHREIAAARGELRATWTPFALRFLDLARSGPREG